MDRTVVSLQRNWDRWKSHLFQTRAWPITSFGRFLEDPQRFQLRIDVFYLSDFCKLTMLCLDPLHLPFKLQRINISLEELLTWVGPQFLHIFNLFVLYPRFVVSSPAKRLSFLKHLKLILLSLDDEFFSPLVLLFFNQHQVAYEILW